MKAFITGGAGFIGSNLARTLLNNGNSVLIYDNLSRGQYNWRNLNDLGAGFRLVVGDILNTSTLENALVDFQPDVLFHLAALPSHRLALERPCDYLQVDIQGTAFVLEQCRKLKNLPLVIFASSNKVYGKQECPWSEDKPPQPEGPYALSKWGSEKICEMYNQYYHVPCVILRFHHVAGPASNPDLALSIFTEKALTGETLEVHGTFQEGKFISCSADYTHVNDTIKAILLAVKNYQGFNIFNIANPKLTSVGYMAEFVVNKLKSKSTIKQVPMLPHETLVHDSDVSKARKILGFSASIPIENAIDDYIKWRLRS